MDLVADAVAELYGADPQEFTERRTALSAAAKAAGDAAAAKRITALRKPTRAAWVVNSLARADPGAADKLASLADALRAAEQAKDGPRLRELSATRGPLIDALTGQALAAAAVTDAPTGLRDEVSATLTAALADPEVAAAFAAGTLTRAVQWAGFGLALTGADDGDEPLEEWGVPERGKREAPAAEEPAAESPLRLVGGRSRSEGQPGTESPARRGGRGSETDGQPGTQSPARRGGRGSGREAAAVESPVSLDERRRDRERLAQERAALLAAQAAEEAARAAERQRKIFEDAERAVASATATAADAVAAEDRLEAEVHDLEVRLTQARAELADARLRARRAEIAERKARQLLDRLPRPDEDP